MVDIRDIKIMEILQKNGRSTASDIAKEVDLSIPAVGERIKKLIEKGLIKRFSAILNHKNSEHSDHYKDFIQKAKGCVGVMECHSITGSGSHILKIRVKNSQALEDLLYEIQNWPGVSRTQSSVVLSSYKESTDIDLKPLSEMHNL